MDNKTVLITGASKGIGKACAIAFAEAGYSVAVNFLSDEKGAQDTANAVRERGCAAEVYQADTSDTEAVKTMFKAVTRDFGGIDVLVNNAGLVDDAYLLTVKEESLCRSLDVNVRGYFHCARQAALKMVSRKSGVILNISSVSADMAIPGQSVYSATKGAVNSMTACLAKELATYGIRVIGIAPGFVDTVMTKNLPPQKREEYLKAIPMGRFAKPEEVAKAAVCLCSDSFSYLTGQTIILDGGISC